MRDCFSNANRQVAVGDGEDHGKPAFELLVGCRTPNPVILFFAWHDESHVLMFLCWFQTSQS